jgi:lysophospholipase L1-like esterase
VEFDQLQEWYNKYHPQTVIVFFTTENDTSMTNPPGGASFLNRYAISRKIKDIARSLHAYHWLSRRYYKAIYYFVKDENKVETKKAIPFISLYQDNFSGWIDAKAAFAGLGEFCHQRNIRLIFCIFSNNRHLADSEDFDIMKPLNDKIRGVLRQSGINEIILIDNAFRSLAEQEKKLWVREDDSHFSPLAHILAGEAIYEYLQNNPRSSRIRQPVL